MTKGEAVRIVEYWVVSKPRDHLQVPEQAIKRLLQEVKSSGRTAN